MARKQCQVCGQPATVRVEANLNGRNSTMLLCDDHYRQLVRQQKRTVSPLEALFGSRSGLFEDFLGSDFFRIGEDATPVAADTDDVVDASFGEPATAGSGAPRRRGSGLASRISEQSEALLQEAAKHAAEFGRSEVDTEHLLLALADAVEAGTEELLAHIKAMLDPDNLTGDDLDAYIYPRTGQVRNAATKAVGVLTVTGTGTITAGDLFESEGGIQFEATETVDITDSGPVAIRCTTAGTLGNLPAGSVTMMPVQLAGIVSVSNSDTTHDGYDAETDAAYYARFLERIQTPPTSGNVYHYRSWALEVSGVGAVQIYPLGHGDNTVDVVIVDTSGKPASSTLVKAVQDHIDPDSQGLGMGEAPIGAYCYVSAATGFYLPISLQVTALPGSVQAEVTQAVKDAVTAYLTSIAFRQDYVSYAQIAAAILSAPGVEDFANLTVNGGTANIAIADRKVAVLGEVTVTYAG